MAITEVQPVPAGETSPPLDYYGVGAEKSADGSVTEPADKSPVVRDSPVERADNNGPPEGRPHWSNRFFAYIKTREFWITLVLGYVLRYQTMGAV